MFDHTHQVTLSTASALSNKDDSMLTNSRDTASFSKPDVNPVADNTNTVRAKTKDLNIGGPTGERVGVVHNTVDYLEKLQERVSTMVRENQMLKSANAKMITQLQEKSDEYERVVKQKEAMKTSQNTLITEVNMLQRAITTLNQKLEQAQEEITVLTEEHGGVKEVSQFPPDVFAKRGFHMLRFAKHFHCELNDMLRKVDPKLFDSYGAPAYEKPGPESWKPDREFCTREELEELKELREFKEKLELRKQVNEGTYEGMDKEKDEEKDKGKDKEPHRSVKIASKTHPTTGRKWKDRNHPKSRRLYAPSKPKTSVSKADKRRMTSMDTRIPNPKKKRT